jgi:hypothetical protein
MSRGALLKGAWYMVTFCSVLKKIRQKSSFHRISSIDHFEENGYAQTAVSRRILKIKSEGILNMGSYPIRGILP